MKLLEEQRRYQRRRLWLRWTLAMLLGAVLLGALLTFLGLYASGGL